MWFRIAVVWLLAQRVSAQTLSQECRIAPCPQTFDTLVLTSEGDTYIASAYFWGPDSSCGWRCSLVMQVSNQVDLFAHSLTGTTAADRLDNPSSNVVTASATFP